MPIRQFTASFVILLLCGCKPSSTGPQEACPLLTRDNLTDLTVNIVGYDQVAIQHCLGPALASSDVIGLHIGVLDSLGFHTLDSIEEFAAPLRIIRFPGPMKLDSALVSPTIRVRYRLVDSSYRIIDTTVRLYTFPYRNAEIVFDLKTQKSLYDAQDVARRGEMLFIHPFGPEGLFEYDLTTQKVSQIFPYPGGDHIAADSDFVFCDIGHTSISRYSRTKGAVDLRFPDPGTEHMLGMATSGGLLYVRINDTIMKRYTYDGSFVDSEDIADHGYYLAIHNGLLVTSGFTHLHRYDLNSMTRLADIPAPARDTHGIKVYRDTLFYCDYYKRIIGAIPVADLQTGTR